MNKIDLTLLIIASLLGFIGGFALLIQSDWRIATGVFFVQLGVILMQRARRHVKPPKSLEDLYVL
jgi:hypothetical protein